uniref:Uncharacterized protein n=1 Tax=Kalanchoe fedtschenkoi TaxID=63787 RepID=A0A7N0RIY5_KALFE
MGNNASKLHLLRLLRPHGYKRLKDSTATSGPLLPPKGYIPICVGAANGEERKYFVHSGILENVEFAELLRRSEEEFGFDNESFIRVLYEADEFEEKMITMKRKHGNLFRARDPCMILSQG